MNIFRKIPSLKLMYEINKQGKLRNIKSKRIRKPHIDKNGYYVYTNLVNGKGAKQHRLVYEVWGKEYNPKLTINHKDFNKLNNNIDNLEQMSASENVKDYARKNKEKVKHNLEKARSYQDSEKLIKKLIQKSAEARTEKTWNKDKWLMNDKETTLNEAYDLIIKENFYRPSRKTFLKGVNTVNRKKRKIAYKKTWKKLS